MWVPQFLQKNRVLGFSKSSLTNVFNSPFVTRNLSSEITIEAFGSPPERYRHAKQWERLIKEVTRLFNFNAI